MSGSERASVERPSERSTKRPDQTQSVTDPRLEAAGPAALSLQQMAGNAAITRMLRQGTLPIGAGSDAVGLLRHLQRSIGNEAVNHLLRYYAPQLATPRTQQSQSGRGDGLMRAVSTSSQAALPTGSQGDETRPAGGMVQTAAEVGREGGPLPPELAGRIQASRTSGAPLDEETRTAMEGGFGTDFAGVRVHTDTESDLLNRGVSASAFTTGNDIYFRQDAYQPDSRAGRQLLAHELTHVVQQRSMSTSGSGPMTVGPAEDSHEQEAEAVSTALARTFLQREVDDGADKVMRMAEPAPIGPALDGAHMAADPMSDAAGGDAHEIEADRTADDVVRRLDAPPSAARPAQRTIDAPASGISGLGAGRPMSPDVLRRFEGAFGWGFSGVRLHTGPAAADAATSLGARAFARGRDVVFGDKVADPEASVHRQLLAHELTHVVQQDMGAGVPASPTVSSLSSASPARVQAAPLVTNVVTSAAEVGVGGTDITASATVGGAGTRLTWTLNPGGAPPAGVTLIGSGRRVRIHAAQPGAGVLVGGTPIVVRAAVNGTPGDFFDSPPVMLVQVVSATYAAAPPLAGVPSLIPGVPPPNSAEPNRDGIAGNTAVVNAITAPAGRAVTVAFRRSLGAAIAGTTITPGSRTGDIGLRITDTATRARMDETQPSAAGPAARMADLTVNAVPTRVSALAGAGALGPYGVLNAITYASSDALHAPLTRIVGELITNGGDDFNVPPPNAGFNAAFSLALAVPANSWNDQVVTPAGILNAADGRPAIDVNRFVGPGVPHLPRRLIYRQRFQYSSWQGGGGVVSNTIADGRHIRSLIGSPGAFQFRTEHRFGTAAAPPRVEPYVGNPLIVLSNVTAAPTAAGATGLAADGAATANLTVNSTVAGRTVNWSILSGDITITAGNPAALPAPATLQAGTHAGTFRVRAADSIFPNRRVDGGVRVVAVRLRGMRAAPSTVPAGTPTTAVSLTADPGGRTVNWTVDAAAAAAGVTVTPATTGPGAPAMAVTVTRPAGFTGRVTVTATDTVLAARTASTRIRFK